VNIDDDLFNSASEFVGTEEKSKLINEVFARFVAWESAKRLRKLSGAAPDFEVPERGARTTIPAAGMLNEDIPKYGA
jgi:hypothetical protein